MKHLVPVAVLVVGLVASSWRATSAQQQQGPVRPPFNGVVTGSLSLQIDTPATGATLTPPFAVAGWAFDAAATTGTGIDAIHVWAIPSTGSPIFVGAATLGGPRSDVAAVYGSQFLLSGYNLTAAVAIPPGSYNLQVYGRRATTGTFDVVGIVPLTIRGTVLTD